MVPYVGILNLDLIRIYHGSMFLYVPPIVGTSVVVSVADLTDSALTLLTRKHNVLRNWHLNWILLENEIMERSQ